ncbi:MAG TPA: LysR family transcriptional regulator [Steroidobacter sp.]
MPIIAAELSLFVLTVERGSFSAAARHLGVAPSSIMRRIEALESDLGVRLINRTTRRLGLTEAGALLLERGRRLIADADDLSTALARGKVSPSGQLRISASIGFGRRHIATALGDFRQICPDVTIDLQLEDGFIDLVEGGIDIAIRIGRLADSRLRHVTLAPMYRVACASPLYLTKTGTPKRPQDLLAHQCVFVGRGAGTQDAWRFARTGRLQLPRQIIVNTPDAAVATAVGGGGIAHLPTWMVADDIRAGRLVRLLQPFELGPSRVTGVHLIWPERPAAKTTAFVSFLTKRFKSSTHWDI